jgi:hypothetical protein
MCPFLLRNYPGKMQGVGFSVLWEDYLQTSVKKVNQLATNKGNNDDSRAAPSIHCVRLKWRDWGLDMVVAAFGISLSLLIVAIITYVTLRMAALQIHPRRSLPLHNWLEPS